MPLDEEQLLLVNTLSGAVDLVPREAAERLTGADALPDDALTEQLVERRYLLEPEIDELEFLRRLQAELCKDLRTRTPLQCVLPLSFECDLQCSYCWQSQALGAVPRKGPGAFDAPLARRALDAVARLADRLGSTLPPRIQLFGGEPLLPRNRPAVLEVLRTSKRRGWPVTVTTNGTRIADDLDLLGCAPVEEVQVTIDGPAEVHERRRRGSNYAALMDAVDSLLARGTVMVKVRTNVDASNLPALPALAEEIYERKWYARRTFYCYIAPLRDSPPRDTLLRRRSRLLKEVLALFRAKPMLEIFDLVGWDGYEPVRHFVLSGRFPLARPYVCDATLTQLVLAPDGTIHTCTELAHDPAQAVGRYSPRLALDARAFARWRELAPLDVPSCAGCALAPICGGGCQLFPPGSRGRATFCAQVRECFTQGLVNAYKTGELWCASSS